MAIDELDSGIFEYLLGEILRIISEKGKGQLIFTSHNLRPLETIDKGFVAFTTTNVNNRYIRFSNVKIIIILEIFITEILYWVNKMNRFTKLPITTI